VDNLRNFLLVPMTEMLSFLQQLREPLYSVNASYGCAAVDDKLSLPD